MTLEVVNPTAALLDGRYLLQDRVGRGGMATVYRAEDTMLGRIVAVKMIHEGEEAVASTERAHTEKALLASLNHPSLVTLYDAQLEPNRPQYLVMEFVEGPTLAERMSAGIIPPRLLARHLLDVAQGLAFAHAAGIVHRDVKPSNILLAHDHDGPWSAKLADFGIACSIGSSRLTTPGIVLGTLTYMAPEQLRDAEPGTPVDIFALGLVALEALTGSAGYPGLGTGRGAAIARLMNPPTIPENVPSDWRDLLERMTRIEPDERPTAIEVVEAARHLVQSSPVALAAAAAPSDADTRPTEVLPAATSRPRRPQRPSRGRVVAAVAAVVAAGALTAGFATASPAPVADGARIASSTAIRTAVPAEPVVEDTVVEPVVEAVQPSAPVEPVVVSNDDANSDDKADKAEKAEEKAEKAEEKAQEKAEKAEEKAEKTVKGDENGKPGKGEKD